MELIKEIYERDLGLYSANRNAGYKLRKAARGLVFEGGKIAVLHAHNLHLHKLPGGGIEDNESNAEGFVREAFEETGVKIDKPNELGITIEFRDRIGLLQISYVFISDIIVKRGKPDFTQKEIDEGFVLKWLNIEEALHLMKHKDKPATYAGKFILARDLAILEYYQRLGDRL
jgi:ADP-ribose pyrophosphatase YjhB (NUDIX family)